MQNLSAQEFVLAAAHAPSSTLRGLGAEEGGGEAGATPTQERGKERGANATRRKPPAFFFLVGMGIVCCSLSRPPGPCCRRPL